MTSNDENNIRNELYIPKLVTLEVLHVQMAYGSKKMTFQYGRRPPYWIFKYVSIEMDLNDESNIRNKFYMPMLETIEVLHVKMVQGTKKMTFPIWPTTAILDLVSKLV